MDDLGRKIQFVLRHGDIDFKEALVGIINDFYNTLVAEKKSEQEKRSRRSKLIPFPDNGEHDNGPRKLRLHWSPALSAAAVLLMFMLVPYQSAMSKVDSTEPITVSAPMRSIQGNAVFVRGYTRSDGKVVKAHWRSWPDDDLSNNFSARKR